MTGLRFIAAFAVVLHHFGNPPSFPQHLHNLLSHGFIAVSLFFILSGFILTYNYIDPAAELKTSMWDFWVARFARIYPVYLLGFVVYAPLAFDTFMGAGETSPWLTTGVFGAAALTLMQAWFALAVQAWNPPAWSLSAEAFFYLLFPFLAPSILKLNARRLFVAALGLWVVSLTGPMVDVVFGHYDRNFWMFNPLVRLPEFLLGVVLGRFWQMGKRESFERHAAWVSVVSAVLLVTLLSANAPERNFVNGALAPLLMALVYSLAYARGALARLLATRPMVMLGEASYSLYILHWPLWFLITHYLVHRLRKFQTGVGHFIACEALTIAAALLAYRYLERPANQRLKALMSGRRRSPQPVGSLP